MSNQSLGALSAKEKNVSVKMTNKVKSITVIGRRYFNKRKGSTYHSVKILVNNNLVCGVPYAYGYGDQYIYTAVDRLESLCYLLDLTVNSNGSKESLREYCCKHKISLYITCTDVMRKKDL